MIRLVFKKKNDDSLDENKPENEESDRKQSNYKVPKHMRKLFTKKKSMTKKIMKTTSASKCLALRTKIESIEQQIKENYTERRKTQIKRCNCNDKEEPKSMLCLCKEVCKTNSGLGP